MRTVIATDPGKVEVNWMWLPAFCADSRTKKFIEEQLAPRLVGKVLTEEVLDWAHEQVLDILCDRHKIEGLRDYLDSLKFVEGPE
jgi:hypothetical protein